MMNDNEIPFGNDNNAETEKNARGKDKKSSHANSSNYSNESNDTTPQNNDSYGNRFYDSQRERTYSTQYPHDGQYNQRQGNYRQNNYNRDGQQQQGNYRQNNYNRDGQQQGNYRQNNYNRDGQQGNYRQNNYNRDGQQGNYRQYPDGNRPHNPNHRRDNQQFRHRNNNFQRNNNPRNRNANSPRFKGRPNRTQNRNKRSQPQRQRLTPLVKLLRTVGFASPRICVEIIRSGRVFVNGNIFNNPNASVNSKRDSIAIDGLNINERNQNLYIIINKQKNIVGSNENTHNSIYNQVKTNANLYFPFGCLERATSGLVFATTDINFRLPDNPLCASTPIEYKIKVHKTLTKRQVTSLSTKFRTRTSGENSIEYINEYKRHSWIKCKVINTKPTVIRKFLKEAGLEVLSFERFAIGSLTTDVLQRGMWTRLTSDNVKKMLREPIQKVTIEDISHDENTEGTDISLRQKVRSLYRNWFMK